MTIEGGSSGALPRRPSALDTEMSWLRLVRNACARAEDRELRFSARQWPSCVRQQRRFASGRYADEETSSELSETEGSAPEVVTASHGVVTHARGGEKLTLQQRKAKSHCKHCGQLGHWVPECPDRREREKDPKVRPLRDVRVSPVQLEHAGQMSLPVGSDLGPGDALVDTCNPRSCAGRRWHEQFRALQARQGMRGRPLHAIRHEPVEEFFKFGTGPTIRATERWTYEVCVAGTVVSLVIFQLPDDTPEVTSLPAILGFDTLGRWETQITLKDAWKGMTIFGRPVQLNTARTGHPYISLMEEPDEEPTSPPIKLVPLEAAPSSNANPRPQVASPAAPTMLPSEEEPAEAQIMEGGRCVLLIYADVPQEEDAASDEHPVPSSAVSSEGSNDGRVPLGNFGHDAFDEYTNTSDEEGVALSPLCAMSHAAIAEPCDRCSLLTCGECGCEGGHESYYTRFRIQLSLGASLTEANERSVLGSSATTDPERSVVVRSSSYTY